MLCMPRNKNGYFKKVKILKPQTMWNYKMDEKLWRMCAFFSMILS